MKIAAFQAESSDLVLLTEIVDGWSEAKPVAVILSADEEAAAHAARRELQSKLAASARERVEADRVLARNAAGIEALAADPVREARMEQEAARSLSAEADRKRAETLGFEKAAAHAAEVDAATAERTKRLEERQAAVVQQRQEARRAREAEVDQLLGPTGDATAPRGKAEKPDAPPAPPSMSKAERKAARESESRIEPAISSDVLPE